MTIDSSSTKTSIDLLRHGKLKTSGLFCADENEPLSEEGLKDCLNAVFATTEKQWDIIISSPYKRCQQFAKQLAIQNQCPLQINDAFQEMDFGDWTGQPLKTLWKNEEQALTQLWQSPETFSAPNGETMKAFTKRVQLAWKLLLKQYAGQSILLITHAGVIRALLAEALDISQASTLRFHLGYAEFTCLDYYSDGVYSLRSLGANPSEKSL